MAKPEQLSRSVIYESPWVNLYVDRVRFPDGRLIERHHLVDFDHASVVAVVHDDRGGILGERVTRYTTGATEWELPAGGLEEGEDPLDAARREVREETGFDTRDHRLVGSYFPLPGISSKVVHVVSCRAGERSGMTDGEVDDVRWFSRSELDRMVRRGEMRDGVAIVALHMTQGECK